MPRDKEDDKVKVIPFGRLPDPPKIDQPQRHLMRRTPEEEIFAAELDDLSVRYDYGTKGYTVPDHGEDPSNPDAVRVEVLPKWLFDALVIRGNLEMAADEFASFDRVNRYLHLWRAAEERKVIAQKREDMAYCDREAGQQELANWLKVICWEGHELSRVIMTQWIWLVRRKLYGLPCESHVMPVLYGQQGGGKSIAVRELIAPLDPLTRKWTFDQMVDDRNWLDLPRCYIGFVEEMAGASGNKISEMKSLITGDTKDVRLMHTQDSTKVRVNTTFIGDSNHQITDIIKDSTGGRRFWELRCRNEIDREALAKIDPRKIWGCVSEHDPCPTQNSPHFKTIKDLQNSKIRHRTSVDRWIEEAGLIPGKTPTPTSTLHTLYKAYCREAGISRVDSRDSLISHLRSLGFERIRVRLKKGDNPVRCVLITPICASTP